MQGVHYWFLEGWVITLHAMAPVGRKELVLQRVWAYLFIGHDLLSKLVSPLLCSLGDAPELVCPARRIVLQLHSL